MDFPSLPSKAAHKACLAFTWVSGIRKSVLELVLKHFTTGHLANPGDLFWTVVRPAQSWGLRGGTTAQHSHCSGLLPRATGMDGELPNISRVSCKHKTLPESLGAVPQNLPQSDPHPFPIFMRNRRDKRKTTPVDGCSSSSSPSSGTNE